MLFCLFLVLFCILIFNNVSFYHPYLHSQRVSDFKPEQPNTILTSQYMLSLNNRPLNVSNGTLLVSLPSGRIQVWSHHERTQCYITDFDAIHVAGDVSKWLIDVHFAC